MDQTGMGNFVGVLKEPHISKKKGYLGVKLKRKKNVGDDINDKKSLLFHLHTVLLTF